MSWFRSLKTSTKRSFCCVSRRGNTYCMQRLWLWWPSIKSFLKKWNMCSRDWANRNPIVLISSAWKSPSTNWSKIERLRAWLKHSTEDLWQDNLLKSWSKAYLKPLNAKSLSCKKDSRDGATILSSQRSKLRKTKTWGSRLMINKWKTNNSN